MSPLLPLPGLGGADPKVIFGPVPLVLLVYNVGSTVAKVPATKAVVANSWLLSPKAGVDAAGDPVNVGLSMLAFNANPFASPDEDEFARLFMALDNAPIMRLATLLTNCVVAILVLASKSGVVTALGLPVKTGEFNGANKGSTLATMLLMLAITVAMLELIDATSACSAAITPAIFEFRLATVVAKLEFITFCTEAILAK